MKLHCQNENVSRTNRIFKFSDHSVLDADTPLSLGLKDEDVIHAIVTH